MVAGSNPATPISGIRLFADIIDITSSRNYSYLEHGYNRVSKETGKKILAKMEGVVTAITSKAGIRRNPLDCAEELRLES